MDSRNVISSPNLGDDQCGSSASSDASAEFNMRSCCESTAPLSVAAQQKNMIIETLSEIEKICTNLVDDPKLSSDSCDDGSLDNAALIDAIVRTSLIARRTPVSNISLN
jgi:hypothetical protein